MVHIFSIFECLFYHNHALSWHGVKVGPGYQESGPRYLRAGTQDPSQSLKVGHRTPLKFKNGIARPPSKFKSGTLIIMFLHCLNYFVLDKYIYII